VGIQTATSFVYWLDFSIILSAGFGLTNFDDDSCCLVRDREVCYSYAIGMGRSFVGYSSSFLAIVGNFSFLLHEPKFYVVLKWNLTSQPKHQRCHGKSTDTASWLRTLPD